MVVEALTISSYVNLSSASANVVRFAQNRVDMGCFGNGTQIVDNAPPSYSRPDRKARETIDDTQLVEPNPMLSIFVFVYAKKTVNMLYRRTAAARQACR